MIKLGNLICIAGYALTLVASAPTSTSSTSSTSCTAKKPFGSGCAFPGHVNPASFYYYTDSHPQPQRVDTLEECATLCARRVANKELMQDGNTYYDRYSPYCESFWYDNSTNLCQLSMFRVGVDRNILYNPNSHKIYYNPECFDCGKICDQPYGVQLIDNGNFEGPLLGPWASGAGNLREGDHSRHSFHCNEGPYSFHPTRDCTLWQSVNMCPGQIYALKFNYKVLAPDPSDYTALFVYFGQRDKPYTGDASEYFDYTFITDRTETDTWHTAYVYFIYYETGGHWGPIFSVKSPYFQYYFGQMYLDNVRLTHVPTSPSLKKPERNVIINGGFEDGTTTGSPSKHYIKPWTQYSEIENFPFEVVSPGIKSERGLRFRVAPPTLGLSPLLTQKLKTIPNTPYLFSFDMEITHNRFELVITLGDGYNGEGYDGKQLKWLNYYGAGSHSVVFPFYAVKNTTSLALEADDFSFRHAPPNTTILLDNFKMVEIDDPFYK